MKRLMSIACAVMLTTVALSPFASIAAKAQNSNGYIISPVREELTIEKGKSQTVTLTIKNATGLSTTAKIVTNDFIASNDESGQPRILLDGSTSEGNSFKSLVGELPTITLGANESKEIKVKISVPNNATPGGYYGAIRLTTDLDNTGKSNVSLAASVGTIFLVKVPGDLTEKLELVEFTTAKNSSTGRVFINSGKMSIITRLRNTGNIHVAPYGKVQISHNGKVIEEYEFNSTTPRNNVLPNSIRKFEDKLKNKNWIGKYSITANLGYGNGGSLITANNTFWVIPLWFVITVVVVILALAVAGYFIYRKINSNRHKVPVRR